MRERIIWIVLLVVGALSMLVADGSVASKLTGLVILSVGAMIAEWITRAALAKAAKIRQGHG